MRTRFEGRGLLFLPAIALLLGGCATTTVTGVTSACSVWKAVSWSSKDTDRTIAEVKVSNARRKAFCEG